MNPIYPMSLINLIHRGSNKSAKIDLKINIENFGPVTKGVVDLKPLTVFIGPNNSGKSYVAMLIHSILSSKNAFGSPSFGFQDDYFPKMFLRYERDFIKIINQNKDKHCFAIPKSLIKKVHSTLIKDVFSTMLDSSLSYNFGSPTHDLITAKHKTTKITISDFAKLNIQISKKLHISSYASSNRKYTINFLKRDESTTPIQHNDDETIISVNKHDRPNSPIYYEAYNIVSLIASDLIHTNTTPHSFYFPAGRSGILQGHRALAASIIKNAPFGGIESLKIPQLTGIISSFISDIIDMPVMPGPFSKLAQQLEQELFHGRIQIPHTKNQTPEIIFDSKHGKIPLHRTSSTISEIAPLSLYLKYIIGHNNLLIIEEPEAHLHPANQLILAKYIMKMIRSGLYVLVTTHSVFLLEQLGKFMLVNKIKAEDRKKLGFAKNDYLLPEEVAPYLFTRKRDGHHQISLIKTNDEDGIPQQEFIKVSENLYEQSIKIQQYMES